MAQVITFYDLPLFDPWRTNSTYICTYNITMVAAMLLPCERSMISLLSIRHECEICERISFSLFFFFLSVSHFSFFFFTFFFSFYFSLPFSLKGTWSLSTTHRFFFRNTARWESTNDIIRKGGEEEYLRLSRWSLSLTKWNESKGEKK